MKDLDIGVFSKELAAFIQLANALCAARKKHPDYAAGNKAAFDVIMDEVSELSQAISYESEERQIEEAMDVAVTAMRFVLGEHKK